jgi:hypothetical protein
LLDAVLKFTLAFASVLILRQKSDFLFLSVYKPLALKQGKKKQKLVKKNEETQRQLLLWQLIAYYKQRSLTLKGRI